MKIVIVLDGLCLENRIIPEELPSREPWRCHIHSVLSRPDFGGLREPFGLPDPPTDGRISIEEYPREVFCYY